MKPRLVCFSAVMLVFITGALVAQPPAGRDPGQRLENMLTRTLGLSATQQNQVHTILADAQLQSQAVSPQLKAFRTSLVDAIKANNTTQIDSISQQMAPLQAQLDSIRSKAAAQIYALLTSDQQAKVENGLGMLMGGGVGPSMFGGGHPPKQ